MSEILSIIIPLISTSIGAIITFLVTKKKYRAEVESVNIANMKSSLEFYISLSENNKYKIEEAIARNILLEKEIQSLKEQISFLIDNSCVKYNCTKRLKYNSNECYYSNRAQVNGDTSN